MLIWALGRGKGGAQYNNPMTLSHTHLWTLIHGQIHWAEDLMVQEVSGHHCLIITVQRKSNKNKEYLPWESEFIYVS